MDILSSNKVLQLEPLAPLIRQGERLADNPVFVLPKMRDGIDQTALAWEIRATSDHDTIVIQSLTADLTGTDIRLPWVVEGEFTAVAGALYITLCGKSATSDIVVKYVGSTALRVLAAEEGAYTPPANLFEDAVKAGSIAAAAASSAAQSAAITENNKASATASAAAALSSASSAAESAALAQQISQQSKGWYATYEALHAAHPTGENGDWAIVGGTIDTIWVWDTDITDWKNTHQQTDMTNYYTKAQADAAFLGKTETAAAATKLAKPIKIGNADFDGTKNITLAQMGIDLTDTVYTFNPVTGVQTAFTPILKKNNISGVRCQLACQLSKSLSAGVANQLGTTNIILNASTYVSLPCYILQQGVGEFMGTVLFTPTGGVYLLCNRDFTFTAGATYPIMVYICNY